MGYSHTYYDVFGKLGEIEVTVEYHPTKAFPGSNEEPKEEEGFEVDAITAENIGCLMGIYNLGGDFADDVNERISEEHDEGGYEVDGE